MKILILGASGMLGSTIFRHFSSIGFETIGTVRKLSSGYKNDVPNHSKLIGNVEVLKEDSLIRLFAQTKPDVVINCIGLIKQLADVNDPLITLPINAMLPHRLATLSKACGARLIHFSTDCVFSGKKGGYSEEDESDALDLYGKSKFIGELHDYDNALTIRTSIIGHGLTPNSSLVDWFLSRKDKIYGYKNAIFSGLPTIEIASILEKYVIPNETLHGLYHVSAKPISKFDLLNLVARQYDNDIEIISKEDFFIDRSLLSDRFHEKTGYVAATWPELISLMHQDYVSI